MKKVFRCCLVLGLIGTGLPAIARAVPKSDIVGQIIASNLEIARIEYETAMDTKSSLAVRAEFMSKTLDDIYTHGIGGGIAYRYYPMSDQPAPAGMFIGPGFDAINISASNAGETSSSFVYNLQAEFGYRFLFGEGLAFVLVPQVYLGYTWGQLSVGGNDLDLNGLGYGASLGVGIAW
jgi:hypothetical protein